MGKPHKHAALIKAWADGAEIEYRIAPERLVMDRQVHLSFDNKIHLITPLGKENHLRLTFEDRVLVDAEVIK